MTFLNKTAINLQIHPSRSHHPSSLFPPEIIVVQGGSFIPCKLYLRPSLLPRPQHPAAILILLWVAAAIDRSRSPSHWLSVRSVRTGWLPELDPEAPGFFEEMVRKMWLRLRRNSPPAAPRAKLPFRRTIQVLVDLAGQDLWLYSSWDRWDA